MSETATTELNWPLAGGRLAWVPQGNSPALAAVPVTAKDVKDGLLPRGYRARLAERLAWMIEAEANPSEAIEALQAALVARDLWPGVSLQASSVRGQVDELLTDNPLWGDYLNLRIELPGQRPMTPRPVPAAMRAVAETTFPEWMDLAFGAALDLT